MFFTKYPHPSNFTFTERLSGEFSLGGSRFTSKLTSYEGDIHLLSINAERWGENRCLEGLQVPPPIHLGSVRLDKEARLTIAGQGEGPMMATLPGKGFGVSGDQWVFQFEVGPPARFYGMGEKTFGRIELSGLRTKFWNTDVWSDFHMSQWADQPIDPPYFSFPYVIVRHGDRYVGLLLHNPYPTFMQTPGADESRPFVEWQNTGRTLILGAEGGRPDLWILVGPTLPELTRKLQKLVGTTPRPPIWSLGYHQSRWGYRGHDDLVELDSKFAQNQIPCDGLWMDLEYMNGYRIFDTSREAFPGGVEETARQLAANGRRIVPILDPGVKLEPGYPVYDEGHTQGMFCRNVEGHEFVGLVWPGETVFPDFTMPKVRDWWAGKVQGFACEGFGATWIDMNDPSTGPVDPTGMLFDEGRAPHEAYHNQYALGMQMATYEGFKRARPDERPFVLSRSGFIGTSRHAAVWTGDNVSNYFYLSGSIPTCLGLSISGQPFIGPDLGGFGGDADEQLISDWFKCAFLFPFMRNHSVKDSRHQEPFAYPKATADLLRRYIRLRYKLVPYLYNLFIEQELEGDPILRPLFYEFEDEGLDAINDQFLVGPSILQAPFVAREPKNREVRLPGPGPWFDASAGEWAPSGTVLARRSAATTPLYIVAGAIVPMQTGTATDNRKELRSIDLHVFLPEGWSGKTTYTYRADDGLSFKYREGGESELRIEAVAAEGHLAIATEQVSNGHGKLEPRLVIHGSPRSLRVNGLVARGGSSKVTLTGKALPVLVV